MARWAWVAGPWDEGEKVELPAARSRKLAFRLDGPASASFDINGRHELASHIDEFVTDVHIYRDGTKMYRGRVGAPTDTIDVAHTTAVVTGDYRQILDRRIWFPPAADYTDVEQADIAWDLIAHTQGKDAGDLGITRGAGQVTGATTSRRIDPGMFIGEQIDKLSRAGTADGATAGFDWTITPELAFDIHYPRLGRYRPDVVLEYGGLIAKVNRQTQPGEFANSLRLSGAAGVSPQFRSVADLVDRPEGRWDTQIGDTTATTDPELSSRADALIAEMGTIEPSWSATLRQGGWEGPDHLWLGDTVTFVVQSGRIDHRSEIRVEGLTIDVDDEGEETVAVQFGPPMPDLRRRVTDQDHRLGTLERT